MIARVRHALRLFGATLLAAIVAGGVAGLGSRMAMWLVRLTNDSHNGEVTHANSAVGQWTVEGTVNLVLTGAFFGVPCTVLYLVVRRWLPGRPVIRGLWFSLLLLVVGLPELVFNSEEGFEYGRYVSPAVAIPLFALLFPLYGVVIAPLAERLGRGNLAPPSHRVIRVGGRLALLVFVLFAAAGLAEDLRQSFGFLS